MSFVQAIKNLEYSSAMLERAAAKAEATDFEFAYYLEQMSFSMFTHANDLRNLESILEV